MRLLSVSLLALLAGSPALADAIDAPSKISAVTVFGEGAMITRLVPFTAKAGSNSIIIADLPLDFDAESLRVAGSGDAGFSIVGVSHRIGRLPPAAVPVDGPEQKAVDAIVEKLRLVEVENRDHQAAIAAAEVRQSFVAALIQAQAQPDPEGAPRPGPESWSAIATALAEETARALADRNAAQLRIDANARVTAELNEDLARAQQALDAAVSPQTERSIATIDIQSDTAVSGILELKYGYGDASWQPVYDLRLEQDAQPHLAIERFARVQQFSGEDWSDVTLTLSTARIGESMEIPNLYEWGVGLLEPVTEVAKLADSMGESGNLVMEAPTEPVLVAEEPATEVLAGVRQMGQTVVYDLALPVSLSGDGTVRQFAIDKAGSDVTLMAHSVPASDPRAFLYASVTNTFGGPILPGPAVVFRDGAVIGMVEMPLIVAGESADLPFGVLDGIVIRRDTLASEDGDFGLIGTTNRRVENFRITVESLMNTPVALTVYEQAPVSAHEDVEVTVSANPEPAANASDGLRGVQEWVLDLAPGDSQIIDFGYEITWPGDREIEYSYRY